MNIKLVPLGVPINSICIGSISNGRVNINKEWYLENEEGDLYENVCTTFTDLNIDLGITNPPWSTKGEQHTKILAKLTTLVNNVCYLGPADFLVTNSNNRHERNRNYIEPFLKSAHMCDSKVVNKDFHINYQGRVCSLFLSNDKNIKPFDYDSFMTTYNDVIIPLQNSLREQREEILSEVLPKFDGMPTLKDKLETYKPVGIYINVATMFGTNKLYGKYFLIENGKVADNCPNFGKEWSPTDDSWDKGIFVNTKEDAQRIKELFDNETYLLLNSAFTAGNHTGRNALGDLPWFSSLSEFNSVDLSMYIDRLRKLDEDSMKYRKLYDEII